MKQSAKRFLAKIVKWKKDKTENEFDQERIFSLVCCSVLTIGFSSSFSGAKVDFRSKAAGFLCQRGSSVILWRARNKTKKHRVPTRKCILAVLYICDRIEILMLIYVLMSDFVVTTSSCSPGIESLRHHWGTLCIPFFLSATFYSNSTLAFACLLFCKTNTYVPYFLTTLIHYPCKVELNLKIPVTLTYEK